MEQALTMFMRLLQYCSTVYTVLRNQWNNYRYPELDTLRPHSRYFLSDSRKISNEYMSVPEKAVYIEEWVENGEKLKVVRYQGGVIPSEWTSSPFERNARTPWIWVGDRDTEDDYTRVFDKFLVVGNRITEELVAKLFDEKVKNLIYIQSGTFKELKFPGEDLTIEEYDDIRPVQSSR